MGFFDKLFGEKPKSFEDRVWMTTERKYRDLVVAASEDLKADRLSTIVYHFADTGKEVVSHLEQANLPYQLLNQGAAFPEGRAAAWRHGDIIVLQAALIPPEGDAKRSASKPPMSGPTNMVHLAAHHPRLEYDQRVLSLEKHWSMPLEFRAYAALDEPLMEAFGSDRIQPILDQLGFAEHEMLSHPMLSKSIESAQRKISKSRRPETPADTYAEWMRLNR